MAEKKTRLNKGYYHEALDRTYCVCDIVQSMLLDHPAIIQTEEWRVKAEKAQRLLAELYQDIAQKL